MVGRQLPKSVTVLVDSREKVPVVFPKTVTFFPSQRGSSGTLIHIKTRAVTLETGDYYLEEYPDAARIERKFSNAELHKNFLTADRARFMKAIRRLAESCAVPVFFLDMSLPDLFKVDQTEHEASGELLLDLVYEMCWQHNIVPLCLGPCRTQRTRTLAGKYLIHVMLSAALKKPFARSGNVLYVC